SRSTDPETSCGNVMRLIEDEELDGTHIGPAKGPTQRPRGVVFRLAANLVVTVMNLTLLAAPSGAGVRPMVQAAAMFSAGVLGLVPRVPRSVGDLGGAGIHGSPSLGSS